MDRRVARTTGRIKKVFGELIQENSFADITVKMICDAADVERKTFYLHFKDKYDLLDAILKEHFEAFRENVRQIPDAKPDRKSTRLNSSHSGESRMPSSA